MTGLISTMGQETQIAISEFNKRMHALSYTLSEGEHVVIKVTSPESKHVSYLSPTCHLGSAAIHKLSQLENTKEFKETSTLVVECLYDVSDITSYNVLERILQKILQDEKTNPTKERIDRLKSSLSVINSIYQLFTSVDLDSVLDLNQIQDLLFSHIHLNLHQLDSLRQMSLEQFKQIDIRRIFEILSKIEWNSEMDNSFGYTPSHDAKFSSKQIEQALSPELRLIYAAKSNNMQLQHLEKPHEQAAVSEKQFFNKHSEFCESLAWLIYCSCNPESSSAPALRLIKSLYKSPSTYLRMNWLVARIDGARRGKYLYAQRMIFQSSEKARNYDKIYGYSRRNQHWAKKLPSMLKENSCYVAVGFAHLLSSREEDGVDSLPKLLIQAGLTLTPIKSTFINTNNNQSDHKQSRTQNNPSLINNGLNPDATPNHTISANKRTSLISFAKKLYCTTSWQYNQCWKLRNKEKAFLTIEQSLSKAGSMSDVDAVYYAQSLITCALFCRSTSFTAWFQNYKTRSSNTALELLNTARVDASNELYWLAQLINTDSDITREDLFDFANNGVFEPADFAKEQEKYSYYQTIFKKPVVSP